jgi:pyruvate/2-oxoglutarate dehydrogenase complex dihydrolipoamide dehydrogenase (E3) component
VAWVAEDVCEGQIINGRTRKIWWECEKGVGTAIYTHPPQRTWVGLTNDELTDLFYNTNLGRASAVAQAIALLKEKNT